MKGAAKVRKAAPPQAKGAAYDGRPGPAPEANLGMYADIVRFAGDAILSKDMEGRVLTWNPAAERIFGYTSSEIIGQPVTLLFPEDRLAEETQIITRIRRGERVEQYETVRRTKAGALIDVAVSMAPIRDSEGKIVGVSKVVRDITEQRRARQQTAEMERLAAMDRFKTEFLNTTAHELNTPITPIKLQLHFLKKNLQGKLPPDQSRAIDILDRNFLRLQQMVRDLLDASRMQAGRLGLQRKPVDVSRLTADAVDAFQTQAKEAGLTIGQRLAPGLFVSADPNRLTQVLFNLLSNAVKFTPTGGRITVHAQQNAGRVQIFVKDSGQGLTDAQMARMFKPFSQVHDVERGPKEGTGLGLYISRGIVELHSGSLSCQSAGPGQGTTFIVDLPIQ